MATPIKVTPVLKNKASARFNQMLESEKNYRVPSEEKARIKNLVDKVLLKKK